MGARAIRAACVVLLLAGRARAEETPVRIEYRAPEQCPDANELRARVEQRIQRARFAEPGEMARTFRVSVSYKPERSVARVEFVDADGEKLSRTIGADTCDEVVNAIALITALAMEARAGADEPGGQAQRRPTPLPAPRAEPAPATAPVSQAKHSGPRWDAGMGLDIDSGYAPSVAIGLRLFVEWSPSFFSVRASAMHADSGKVSVEGGRTRFRFWGGRLEGCPLRLVLADHLAAQPCAGLDAGALAAEGLPGDEIAHPRETTEPWLAAGVIGRVQADLDDFLLLEAQADARFPLVRHEFYLETPERNVHEVPPVAFGASIGVGFRFQ